MALILLGRNTRTPKASVRWYHGLNAWVETAPNTFTAKSTWLAHLELRRDGDRIWLEHEPQGAGARWW